MEWKSHVHLCCLCAECERDGIPNRLLSHLSAEDYVAASMERRMKMVK